MQIANIRKGWRPLAALAAAVAMLGAVTISQPQTAQAAGNTCTAEPYGKGQNETWWKEDTYEDSSFYKCINDGSVSTINVKGLTVIGRTNTTADFIDVEVNRDLTLNGQSGILRFFRFNVTSGHTLTLTGDLTIDDVLASGSQNTAWIPVTLQANAHLVTRDNVKLISDNGRSEEIDSNSLGYAVRVRGNNATVDLGGNGQYNAQANDAQTGSMYPTVYGPDGAVIVDPGVDGAKVTITSGQVLQENGRRAAVQNAGPNSVTTIGGTANVESVSQNGGTFVMNGGYLDRSLFYSYQDIAGGTLAAHNKNSLTLAGGAKGYVTKGQIWDYNASEHQGDAPTAKSVNLSADSSLYLQAANSGDIRIDASQPWIGQLKGDANADNVQSSPSMGANINDVANFDDKAQVVVNYDLSGKSDLAKLVASEASKAKTTQNNKVQNSYLLNTYAGYHGHYLAYGRYVLNNADEQSTLIDGTGLAQVYGVPADIDYEWYSKAEVTSKQQQKTYPDASAPDQSFLAEGYAGRKFAGWYKSYNDWKADTDVDNIDVTNDANYTTVDSSNTTADGTPGQNKFAWAHFAEAKNQNVAVQVSTTKTAVRFLTAIDTTKYKNVEFNVTYDSKVGEGESGGLAFPLSTQHVYTAVSGKTPKDLNVFGDFAEGSNGYFATAILRNFPNGWIGSGKLTLTITPSWTTLDGTTVTGAPVTKTL